MFKICINLQLNEQSIKDMEIAAITTTECIKILNSLLAIVIYQLLSFFLIKIELHKPRKIMKIFSTI